MPIQSFSAGVDDLIADVPPGVTLCDASGVHDVAMAEWVVMAILASNRHLAEHLAAQRAGAYGDPSRSPERSSQMPASSSSGSGSIGKAVEARLAPFGAQFTRFARRARPDVLPLSELAARLPTRTS